MFNVGIICLQLATLLSPSQFELYSFDDYTFCEAALKQYLYTLYELQNYSSNAPHCHPVE